MYNDKLVYKVVIWVFFSVILWKEKEVLKYWLHPNSITNF